MKAIRFLAVGGLAVVLSLIALTACGDDDDDDADDGGVATEEATEPAGDATEEGADADGGAGGGSEVSIAGFAFEPAELQVGAGTTVTWTNADPQTHTVTADDGAFDSGDLAPGAPFEFSFEEAGTFAYHCEIHNGMTGTIVVGGGAALPESGDPAPAASGSLGY